MVDFQIQNNLERVKEVEKELTLKSHFTPSQLEMLGSYILYGKDKDGTSPVDRGEIQIKTKYSSF